MSLDFSQGGNAQVPALLLISFCNQLSSPGYSLMAIEANGMERSCWIDFSSVPDELRPSFSSVCGICCVGEQIVMATQSSKPVLALLDIKTGIVTHYVALNQCKDTHSLVFHNGYVYMVSTQTNELYRVALQGGQLGQEELYWRYPGVAYDADEVHLNGLTLDEGRLIASCFGHRGADGSFRTEGQVFYVDTGDTILGGLSQPHSPTVAGNRLIIAESAAHKVHVYSKDGQGAWNPGKVLELGGYVRGVALQGDRLWVGISADRKLSRSRQKFIEPGDPGLPRIADSGIVEIDLGSGSQVAKSSLLGFGREVYDILTLSSYPALLPMVEVISARIRAMESCVDSYAAEVGRLALECQKYAENMTLLQRAHEEEIARLHQTLSWRITAPLRAVRRTWSRLTNANTTESP